MVVSRIPAAAPEVSQRPASQRPGRQHAGRQRVDSQRAAAERLLDRPRFEVLPLPGVEAQVAVLPVGATVAITCSPSRGVEATVALAERLAADGFHAVPHLAARAVPDEASLHAWVARLDAAGVREVFVVGGDSAQVGPYADGLALLAALEHAGHPFADVGVPAYPEGHPAIDDATLWADLLAKQAHASYCVTQLCFESARVAAWLATARAVGIGMPVVVGLPGVVEPRRLVRVSLRIGVGESARFAARNASLAWRLLRPGGYRADALVRNLARRLGAEAGIAGVHLYTFNQVAATARWVARQQRRLAAAPALAAVSRSA